MDPLKKYLPWPEKDRMIKSLRITPSVSTETCDVSQPMKVHSDTLSGFRPSRCCDNSCMMSYDNQLVYWNLPAVDHLFFLDTDTKASFTCMFEVHDVSVREKRRQKLVQNSSAKFLM